MLEAQTVTPAPGHDLKIIHGYAATIYRSGLTDGVKCKRCGEWIVSQQVIPRFEVGDVNMDHEIDVLDATVILKYSVERYYLNDSQIEIADVNNDGNVDILDAAEIQKYAAEKISEFKKII